MYALAKANTSDDVHEGLSQIVPHIFGEHKLCIDDCVHFQEILQISGKKGKLYKRLIIFKHLD